MRTLAPKATATQRIYVLAFKPCWFCVGVSNSSRGHAHLGAQGHGYSTPLLVRVDARRHRVSVWNVDAAPCVC
jgi:hypothetical protein